MSDSSKIRYNAVIEIFNFTGIVTVCDQYKLCTDKAGDCVEK